MTEVISGGQLALLRSPTASAPIPHTLTWPLREVATADINQSSFSFPLFALTVNNTSAGWGNVAVGQLIRVFDDSGNLIMTNCVRKTPTSNTLYISAMGRGDPGAAKLIASDLVNGYHIVIYDYQPLWSFRSRISNGVFYKRYDVPYTDEGSNPTPVCNIGQWDHGFGDPVTGQISRTYTAATSFAWAGKTITGYQWVIVGPGYSVTGGSLSSVSFTATFNQGFHLVYCTITDSGGKTKRAVRPLWVTPRFGAGAPLSSINSLLISNDRQDLQGRNLNNDLYGRHDLMDSDVYDGGAFMTVEYATHGGAVLNPGVIIDRHVGFLIGPGHLGTMQHTILQMQMVGVMGRLAKVGIDSQAIIEKASPSNWTEVLAGLNDPSFAAWYVLEHHCPNALALFDYHPLPDSPPVRKHSYGLNSQNIAAMLGEVAAMVMGNFGSASDGSFYFFRNPNTEDDTFRNALETRLTVTTGDFQGEMIYPVEHDVPKSAVTLGGFVVGVGDDTVDAFEAIAPDLTTSQGIGKDGGQSIIIRSTLELRQKVGDLLAVSNSPTPEFSMKMMRNFDVIDPARHYNTWVNLNIAPRFDPRGLGYSGRALVTAVQRDWRQRPHGADHKEVTWTFRPESQGKLGKLLPKIVSNFVPPDVVITDQTPFANLVWACNDQGDFGASDTFAYPGLQWHSIKGVITGHVTDFDFDYHSSLLQSGLRYGTLGMWAVSVNGTTVKIWYTPNVLLPTPVWTNQATYTMADATTVTQVRIAANKRTPNNAWVEWRTRHLTYAVKTVDGSTWTATPIQTGFNSADSAHDDAPLGLCITDNYVLITAHDDLLYYRLYFALASASSFGVVPSLPFSEHPNALIQPADAGNVYAETDSNSANIANIYVHNTTGSHLAALVLETGSPDLVGNWSYGCGGGSMPVFGLGLGQPVALTPVAYQARFSMDNADDWECTQIDVTFAIQSWLVASGTAFGFDHTIELLDKDLNVLYTDTAHYSHTRANNNVSECANTLYSLTGLSVSGVKYLQVTCSGNFNKSASNQEIWGSVQNIAISVNHTVIYRHFYRVEDYKDYDGSVPPPDWIELPTATDFIPRYPFAVAPDGPSLKATFLLSDGVTTNLYSTIDGGDTKTLIRSGVTWTGLRRVGNRLVLWGPNAIDYSLDNGATFSSRVGNWASAIGTVGTFLKVGGIA